MIWYKVLNTDDDEFQDPSEGEDYVFDLRTGTDAGMRQLGTMSRARYLLTQILPAVTMGLLMMIKVRVSRPSYSTRGWWCLLSI